MHILTKERGARRPERQHSFHGSEKLVEKWEISNPLSRSSSLPVYSHCEQTHGPN